MQHLSILGSTGSIGTNTLQIVDKFPERFSVKALTAKNNIKLLAEQVQRFSPDLAVVYLKKDALKLKEMLPADVRTQIMHGNEGYKAAAVHNQVDTVVSAMVGAAGLLPTLDAIDAGKQIALANKETLVMAGDIVMDQAKKNNVAIRPVDSEHSAIYQCLAGNRRQDLEKIFLTASGGPFRQLAADKFSSITPEDALAHPTWEMGKKISIDSATMMNKGLEVIEAKHLFDLTHRLIDVVVHPQSIVHSMVGYKDGSVIAQLGTPDMKGAIAYALSCPERMPLEMPTPDFPAIGSLTFDAPDFNLFPCLALAYSACESGGTMPCVLNASNEVAVDAFLNHQISFLSIAKVIEHTMKHHDSKINPLLADILQADEWARKKAVEWINNLEEEAL
jgi:1-deoxy-D-xylulose-5-phosphate reductoisomerase